MADYTVTTDFKASDGLTPKLKGMEASTKRFASTAKSQFKSIGDVFKGTLAADLTGRALSSGFALVQRGLTSVVGSYMDFDTSINKAAAKFGGIDYGTEQFKQLATVAREVGQKTQFSATDAAEGLNALAGAGFDAVASQKALWSVVTFASAADMSLAEAATVASGALGSFGMSSADAAVQAANLVKISDVLAGAANKTNADMSGLSETITYGAGAFTAAGQSLETFGAIAGALANVNQTGMHAGTVMSAMATRLAKLDSAGKGGLKRLGLDMSAIVDESGNMRNMVDILGAMEAPLKKLGSADQLKVMNDIFGETGGRGVANLMAKGVEPIRQLQVELGKSGGSAAKMGDQLNQSLGKRLDELKSSAEELGFKFVEAFLNDGKGGIEAAIKAVNEFDVKPIVEDLKSALGVVKNMVVFIKDNMWAVKLAAAAFISLKVALAAANFTKWIIGLKGIVSAAPAATAAMNGVAGASGGVNGAVGAAGTMSKGAAAAQAAPGVAGAAAGGIVVGTIIADTLQAKSDTWSRNTTSSSNMLIKMQDKLAAGQATAADMSLYLKQLEMTKKGTLESMNFFDLGLNSIAAAFGATEDPITVYQERAKRMNDIVALLNEQLARMNEQARISVAQGGTAQVNVNVGGPGAGSVSTTSSSSGPQAPQVNVNQAGKN